jgi:molybdopterin-guanine dinucleotide biosynthesis protein A
MGQNKALLSFLGQPLIARVIERVRGLADEVLITSNTPDEMRFLNLPVFADVLPGSGALGGLYTALLAARHPLVMVVACDMPLIRAELLAEQARLLQAEGVDVGIPVGAEGGEPLHAVYRRETCLPAVKAALDTGQRRMISWFEAVKVRRMEPEETRRLDPQGRSFLNVNTPEEFTAVEALARAEG